MVDLPIPPQMGLHAIPEDEHPAAEKVGHHLFELLSFAELFKEDLRLYDYCMQNFKRLCEHEKKDRLKPPSEMQILYLHWRGIPLRDGAMNIRHFGIAAHSVKNALARCPPVSARVNHKALCQALEDFDTAFPSSREVRNAVAHPADKANEAPRHEFTGQHQSTTLDKGNASPITLTNTVEGRRLTDTWKDEVVQYELSERHCKSSTISPRQSLQRSRSHNGTCPAAALPLSRRAARRADP
jgi:hypothetical protein